MTKNLHDAAHSHPVQGVVDGLKDNNKLRGWACLAGPDQPPLPIEVWAGEQCLARVEAAMYRADLAIAGKRAGYCAFEVPLIPIPVAGTALSVTAVGPDGHRHPLTGSPIAVPEPSTATVPTADILPLPIHAADLCGSLDQCGPLRIRGWAHGLDQANTALILALYEGDHELLRLPANQWREDLAELRQGDGCCGFEAPLPDALCDGQLHTLDLRRGDTGQSVLSQPFRVRIRNRNETSHSKQPLPAPLQRQPAASKVTLSVIVNFYNMRREAERTLTSLSRSYQQGADGFDYEVLCIDNGSNPPLDATWIESFGPQFRLLRPSRPLASPCFAINEAVLQARGQYLAIMIDGAHVLTPGIFHEARQAWHEHSEAVIAVRHWFIGGDQRWLAVAGYSREQEDRLFERIHWPNNGYEMFRVGAPIGENPEPWLDGLSESNCLLLPTQLYDRIGGLDEAFDQAGGGFANLDLWKRASDAASGPLVSLLGEATFHQFHGGTTTNIEDAEKDVRVRGYAKSYRALRGEEFEGVHRSRLQFRGTMPSNFATGIRQRTLLPLRLGITDGIRRAHLPVHFDEGAQTYLQSVYAEAGLQQDVSWLGHPTGVAPADLVEIQAIAHEIAPDAVVVVGADAGLAHFVDTVFDAMHSPGARILAVQPASPITIASARITTLHGQPESTHTLATIRHWIGSAENVLVLYTAHAQPFAAAMLQAYGALVSYRSYLICLGTLLGQPWLGYSSREPLKTIQDFTQTHPAFVIDRSRNRQLISTCPSGYLRKIAAPVTTATYDPALDAIDASRNT